MKTRSETIPTVAIYTLGCKVNQSESDSIGAEFEQAGFRCVPFDQPADVYVVNTCTVTHVGDAKSRQVLRQAGRRGSDALVVATGCYTSIVGERMPVDDVLIVRNRDKHRLVDIVRGHLAEHPSRLNASPKPPLKPSHGAPGSRTRAMVKVQDGCDSACSYCIIPRARGRSRSVDPATCVDQVNRLVDGGHKEVVITGVDLGSYGQDDPSFPDLGGLLSLLLEATDIHRIRVSSVEPGDFDLQWLQLWDDARLCPHLHVPLQAGSDSVLQRMRRKYERAQFLHMIETCRKMVPDIAITTDVITGFPGETDEEFSDGLDFITRCSFDGMHVFPFSRRSGTAAASLPDSVREPVKKLRATELRQLADAGKTRLVARNIGSVREVVWETESNGVWRGLTDNNIRVFASDDSLAPNHVDSRRLATPYSDGCWGEPAALSSRPTIQLVAV